ncbi:MAG: hypothetical protein HY207_13675 [Nitrospirae bacterium]|nr:hypothetical protein [Nitrospirota bacterium]
MLAKPVRGVAEHEHLQQLLNDSITLPVRFMLDAERELYYNNHLFALLNAVIALEIVVSDTIRIIANCKGVSPSEINKFIQDVGLTGNIKATLRLLAPQEVVLPDDSIFAQCKSAITLRNNIMHQGQREVPENSVPGYLQNIETMFGFCEHLKTQYSKTQT